MPINDGWAPILAILNIILVEALPMKCQPEFTHPGLVSLDPSSCAKYGRSR